MRATLRMTLVGVCLLALAGCGKMLVGQWRGVDVTGGDKSKFGFGIMEFNEDGTFKGVGTLDGEKESLAGTYSFDGFKLKLNTQETEQAYWSTYNMFNKSLTIKHDDLKARLERIGK